MKVSMPVEAGNAVAKGCFDVLSKILAELKPEAAYFIADNGKRTGIIILNMDDVSQIPSIAEPFFLGLNASIEITPAMVPADLQKAGPSIGEAVKKYAR
jgi:hypothetical protein